MWVFSTIFGDQTPELKAPRGPSPPPPAKPTIVHAYPMFIAINGTGKPIRMTAHLLPGRKIPLQISYPQLNPDLRKMYTSTQKSHMLKPKPCEENVFQGEKKDDRFLLPTYPRT